MVNRKNHGAHAGGLVSFMTILQNLHFPQFLLNFHKKQIYLIELRYLAQKGQAKVEVIIPNPVVF